MQPKGFVLLAGVSFVFYGIVPGVSLIARQGAPANPDAVILQDFQNRVAKYVKLRNQLEASLPPLNQTSSPLKLAEHQRGLAEKIRAARTNVKPGAIFTLRISAEFRRLIRMSMQGPSATRIRSSLGQTATGPLRVYVNETYPDSAPLRSTPPTLLLNLPKLPPELDYRFVGHDLILRDIKADLVVDMVPWAIQ